MVFKKVFKVAGIRTGDDIGVTVGTTTPSGEFSAQTCGDMP
jgi:hypothetical protein